MQEGQSKSCGNCVFFDYTNSQKNNQKKVPLANLAWGKCVKKNELWYKTQTCDEYETKE